MPLLPRSRCAPTALAALALVAFLTSGCGSGTPEAQKVAAAPAEASRPPVAPPAEPGLDLPSDLKEYAPLAAFQAMKIPAENPLTAEKATLGWKLFHDPRLSGKGDRSCYSCHVNEKGLTDGLDRNVSAFDGKQMPRHTPTLWNIGYHAEWYWDGRAKTLEAQAIGAWKLANMGAKDPAEDKIRPDVVARIQAVPEYQERFQKVFGGPATEKTIPQALAAYMRTIVSGRTAYDRFKAGDDKAMSEAAKRGLAAFEKAKCTNCHDGILFTDLQFHNVGIGMEAASPDLGRFKISNVEKDTGAFKTPTLRDVSRSAPYFHDGSVATLEEAVRFMVGGGRANPHLDTTNLQKAPLTEAEILDLIEFLKALEEPTRLPIPKVP